MARAIYLRGSSSPLVKLDHDESNPIIQLSNEDGRNDAGRNRYRNIVDTVTRVINEADPMGLLALECPLDEYSPEVGTIVPRVVKASSADEVKAIPFEEFDRWFGSCSIPRGATFDRPAQAIWQAVLDFRSPV